MGNCLEPSDTEIRRARRAKREKAMSIAARQEIDGGPKMVYYQPNPSIYHSPVPIIPRPHGAPPPIVAMTSPSGQQFLMPYPGAMDVPFIQPPLYVVEHPNGMYVGNHSRRGVDDPKGIKTQTMNNTDTFGELLIDTNNNNNKTEAYQNGGPQLFTTTGIVNFQEEPETEVIVDYVEPALPLPTSSVTITTTTQNSTTATTTADVHNSDLVPFSTSTTNHHFVEPALESTSQESRPPLMAANRSSRPSLEYIFPTTRVAFSPDIDTIDGGGSARGQSVITENGSSSTGGRRILNDEDIVIENQFTEISQPEKSSLLPEIVTNTLHQTSSPPLPTDPVDVVITYSVLGDYELDIVRRLTRQLELVNLTVWAERLGDSSRARKSEKTAEAILGAKVLIVMLSEGSCEQRFIRDHVAMATMANLAIFPAAFEPPKEILEAMPLELKVQLTPYKWTELTSENEDSFLFKLRSLVRSVQDEVDEYKNAKPVGMTPRGDLIQRRMSLTNPGLTTKAASFWDVHFGHRDNVKWGRLISAIKEEFKTLLQQTVPNQMQTLFFQSLMSRHRGTESDVVYRSDFLAMCKPSGGQETDVWDAIVRMAGILQAVRDVLEVDSTVRRLVAEYIEYFKSPPMIDALRGLLFDPDSDLRTLTVVCLARCTTATEREALESIKMALQDEDGQVRGASCLALGHLRDETALEKLTYVWQNDKIPEAKKAARMSMDQIESLKATTR